MKKTTKMIAVSLAAITILSGVATFGKNLAKQVDIYYRDIKININGNEITPKNADGETVEPFIYDGTTYLPVRAVANAVGMDVSWDDETSTVTLVYKKEDSGTSEDITQGKPETDPRLYEQSDLYAGIDSRLASTISKSELDNEILLNISGVPMSAASLRYAVIACASSHGNSRDEETKAVMAKEIDEYFRTNAAVVNLAEELGIDLTKEDFEQNISSAYNSLKSLYGDNLTNIIESYTYHTPFVYFLTTYYNTLFSKICDAYMNDDTIVDSIKNTVLASMTSEEKPYVRAKHVLIAFPENATEEDKATALTLANDVYAKAKAGEDFDTLVKEYGQDPGMISNPHGYYFTYGMMVEPFEKTSFALKGGDISEPVETSYGYHIIQRLPLDDTTALKNTSEFLTELSKQVNTLISEKGKEYTIVYSSTYSERYADFESEIPEN